MKLDRPETEKFLRLMDELREDAAVWTTLQRRNGELVKVDIHRVLAELAQNIEAVLHFMDPPKHHADVYPKAAKVYAIDNPTGQVAVGSASDESMLESL